MDFDLKKRGKDEINQEIKYSENHYRENILFYNYPPTEDIHIEEFDDLALERLRLLRVFERASTKGLRFLSDEWKNYIYEEFAREGLRNYLKLCVTNHGKADMDTTYRRDYLSHFILRLAYCRSETLARWFVTQEMDYFKYKFSTLSSAEIKQFLEDHNFAFQKLTDHQINEIKDGLYDSTMGQSISKIELLDFYKVPFTQVLDLVRNRRCYVKNGFAYISTSDLVFIVAVKQQKNIEDGLAAAKASIHDLESDERISRMLKLLHKSYTGKDYTVNRNCAVPIESLDQLSKTSMPLCMRLCHDHIRSNHHIKHGGRMQYGLFLKGIGVTLEDSLRFWREEFTKKIDADKFARSYEYSIQHNYGKKGSMVNYTPYSCLKIIQNMCAPGDCHGCPYKTMDAVMLKSKLMSNGLSVNATEEVMFHVSRGNYQHACGKYFMLTHNSQIEPTINHPNSYFEESQILMGNRKNKTIGILKNEEKPSFNKPTMDPDLDDELWKITELHEKSQISLQ